MTTIGSFCSGIGGLELGLELADVGEVVWQSEVDPHASAVLARHFPDVPNLGDLRAAVLPAVDVVCAGFPCQPVSSAGRRKGLADERWLFDDIAEALGRMEPRPRLLVFENVPGLLSAGGGDAMARVLHRLAALGYVGRWRTVRASDVGAPHRRERVFVIAWHSDLARANALAKGRGPWHPVGESGGTPTHARSVIARATPADTPKPERRGAQRQGLASSVGRASELGERPSPDAVLWGAYAPAIARWERILGRPAPAPLDDRRRLSSPFVEWMMGFPAGWVDGPPRTATLRCLGNAVVPQQAALAVRLLLSVQAAA